MHQLKVKNFSLQHTLASGQTFCWKQSSSNPDQWQGYIYDIPCLAQQVSNDLILESPPHLNLVNLELEQVKRYFNLTPEFDSILASLPPDPWLQKAQAEVAGLRCIQEPWWECTANFICSSLKQITQIEQINQNLRLNFGQPILNTPFHRFPSAETIASLSEQDLRSCKLGYRARHLHRAARKVAEGHITWDALAQLPLKEASEELQKLDGVGEKVANCILLYAGNYFDAFPFDVWVYRLMHQLYYPKKRIRPDHATLEKKSRQLFGPNRGLAQQFLFHWFRTCYLK